MKDILKIIKIIDTLNDDRLSPMTYKKLKEYGITNQTWKNWTQEQANNYLHSKEKKAEKKKLKELKVISPDNKRITTMFGSKIIKGIPGSNAAIDYKCEYKDKKLKKECQDTYNEIRKKEPQITKDIQSIIGGMNNIRMDGLEFSVKSGSSLTRKVLDRLRFERLKGKTEKDVMDDLVDIVRYTVLSKKTNDIAKDTQNIINNFKKKGYKILELDNKWLTYNDKKPYRGVHLTILSPTKQKFEFQVHSEDTIKIKNKSHEYYNISRDTSRDKKEIDEAKKKQVEVWKDVKAPKGIEKLKSFKIDE